MKILIIGHSFVDKVNQKKILALSKFSDIKISLLVPYQWKALLKHYQTPTEYKDYFNIICDDVIFNGNPQHYLYKHIGKIIKESNPDIIHLENEPYSFVAYQVSLAIKNLSKKIFFTWENIYQRFIPPLHGIIHYLAEKNTLKNFDWAIAGNQSAKEILISKGFKGGISVIPQFGIDTDEFHKIDSCSLKEKLKIDNAFVIGYFGRLVKEKGILNLIKASAKLDYNYKLLIVGNGPLKSNIIELSKKLEISERVIVLDSILHSDIVPYINCLDVLVLPSLTTKYWKEQFGRILIEAMACEIPVIGSSSGEIPNVIEDAGLIFNENDIDELAKNLTNIYYNNNLREELKKKGLARVKEKYTTEKIVEEIYKIYKRL